MRVQKNKQGLTMKAKVLLLSFAVLIIISSLYFLTVLNVLKIAKPEFLENPVLKTQAENVLLKPPHNPSVEDSCFGRENASVSIVTFTRFDCDACKEFARNIYPVIDYYVRKGVARYCHKTVLNNKDFQEQNKELAKTVLLKCLSRQVNDTYWLYNALYDNNVESFVLKFKEKFNKTINVQKCLDVAKLEILRDQEQALKLGVVEYPITYIGINGVDNVVLVGVPSKKKFNKAVYNVLLRLGFFEKPDTSRKA